MEVQQKKWRYNEKNHCLTTVGITHLRTLKSGQKKSESRSVEPISLSEVLTVSNLDCPNKKYGNKMNPLSIWTYWNEILANVRHLVIDFWAYKTRHRNHFGQWNLEKSSINSFTRIVMKYLVVKSLVKVH